jgi:hypothetical protein
MIKNFVIIAWRNLLRNKLHSFRTLRVFLPVTAYPEKMAGVDKLLLRRGNHRKKVSQQNTSL